MVATTRNPAWSTQAVPPFIYLEKSMSIIFTCEQCSIQFAPSRSGQVRRFCGMACWKASKPRCTSACLQCGESTTNPRFCSKSCAATFNNTGRIKSEETKKKLSDTMKTIYPRTISWKDLILGPYTRVVRNICCKTGLLFYSKSRTKYHPSVIEDKQHYAILCKFRFSISQFPLWFDGSLIEKHGWYSTPGSRKGIKNLNGVSRDHRISIDYGYQHGLDPSIIRHPANCQLVLHTDNQRKNVNCSINLQQLLDEIEIFEKLYQNWQA